MDRNQRWKDLAEAEALLPEMRRVGDRLGEGDVQAYIGTTYLLLGQVEEGIAVLDQALAAYRAVDHACCVELVLRHGGIARLQVGRPAEAIPLLEEALGIARKRGDGAAIRENLSRLGTASCGVQKREQAVAYLQEALAILRISGGLVEEIHELNRLGVAYLGQGRMAESLACYESALALARERESREGEASALQMLGDMHTFWLGQPEQGIDFLNQALALFRRLGDSSSEAKTHLSLAGAQVYAGRAQAALLHFGRARSIAQELGDTALLENVFAEMGKTYSHLSQPEEAIGFYQRALQLGGRRRGGHQRKGEYLNDLGALQLNRGDPVEAHLLFEQALALARCNGDLLEEACQLENIALALEQITEEAASLSYYKQAIEIFQCIGNRVKEGEIYLSIGLAYGRQGRRTKSLAYLEMDRHLLDTTRSESESPVAQFLEQFPALADGGDAAHQRTLRPAQRHLRWLHLQRYWQALGEPLGRWYSGRGEPALTDIGEPEQRALGKLGLSQVWQQGMEAVGMGRWIAAASCFQEILRRVREEQNSQASVEAHALAQMGNALARSGDLNEGESAILEAHDLFHACADRYNELATLFLIGSLTFQAGWMEEAIEYWDIARFTAELYGEHTFRGMALRDIGLVYRDYYEDMREARRCLEEALGGFQQADDRQEEGETLAQLGILSTEMGYRRKAVQYHQRARDLFHAAGVQTREGGQLLLLASAYAVAEQFEDAAHVLEQSRKIYRGLGNRQCEARAEAMLGIGEMLRGNLDRSLASLRAGLALVFEEGGKDREVLSRWLTLVTTMAEQEGKPSL